MTAVEAAFTRVDLERCESDIAHVERAIEALEQGTFAQCAVCGTDIAEVVRAEPLASRCAAHPV
jgi:RNA polymerase-binding transcription factor DksA